MKRINISEEGCSTFHIFEETSKLFFSKFPESLSITFRFQQFQLCSKGKREERRVTKHRNNIEIYQTTQLSTSKRSTTPLTPLTIPPSLLLLLQRPFGTRHFPFSWDKSRIHRSREISGEISESMTEGVEWQIRGDMPMETRRKGRF